MNKEYVRTEPTCKDQSAICLRHMEERCGGIAMQKWECAPNMESLPITLPTWVVQMIDVVNQDCGMQRRKANLSLRVNLSILLQGEEKISYDTSLCHSMGSRRQA
jgi:hypothetical protein